MPSAAAELGELRCRRSAWQRRRPADKAKIHQAIAEVVAIHGQNRQAGASGRVSRTKFVFTLRMPSPDNKMQTKKQKREHCVVLSEEVLQNNSGPRLLEDNSPT